MFHVKNCILLEYFVKFYESFTAWYLKFYAFLDAKIMGNYKDTTKYNKMQWIFNVKTVQHMSDFMLPELGLGIRIKSKCFLGVINLKFSYKFVILAIK